LTLLDLLNVVIALASVVLVELVGIRSVVLVVGDWVVVVMMFAVIQVVQVVCSQLVFPAKKSTLVENIIQDVALTTLHEEEWMHVPYNHSVVNAIQKLAVSRENGKVVVTSAYEIIMQ